MDKMRTPWKFTRRDTDSVQLEGISGTTSGAEPVEYGKDIQSQAKPADSDTHSDEAKGVEEGLRKFSALHEFDPNLPCKYGHFHAHGRSPHTCHIKISESYLIIQNKPMVVYILVITDL